MSEMWRQQSKRRVDECDEVLELIEVGRAACTSCCWPTAAAVGLVYAAATPN